MGLFSRYYSGRRPDLANFLRRVIRSGRRTYECQNFIRQTATIIGPGNESENIASSGASPTAGLRSCTRRWIRSKGFACAQGAAFVVHRRQSAARLPHRGADDRQARSPTHSAAQERQLHRRRFRHRLSAGGRVVSRTAARRHVAADRARLRRADDSAVGLRAPAADHSLRHQAGELTFSAATGCG